MASNCEDVSAQMMELLYGELPADARASVDAHVTGCARCRTEMEGFEKTRAIARRALDEAPPPRVHAAIMQAAAAHLATQQAPAAQAQPAAPARQPAAAEKVSFWDRLRTRWAFPTLATVGAVAVFVVANRVFLNPERALEPHHTVEAPAAAPMTPPVTAEAQGAGVAAQPSASEPNAAAADRERSPGGRPRRPRIGPRTGRRRCVFGLAAAGR
jgi:anti-sigma factor RsiW